MSKDITRKAVDKLQHGGDLTLTERAALAEVLSYEQMSKLLTIVDNRADDFLNNLFGGSEVTGTPTPESITVPFAPGKGTGKGLPFKGVRGLPLK